MRAAYTIYSAILPLGKVCRIGELSSVTIPNGRKHPMTQGISRWHGPPTSERLLPDLWIRDRGVHDTHRPPLQKNVRKKTHHNGPPCMSSWGSKDVGSLFEGVLLGVRLLMSLLNLSLEHPRPCTGLRCGHPNRIVLPNTNQHPPTISNNHGSGWHGPERKTPFLYQPRGSSINESDQRPRLTGHCIACPTSSRTLGRGVCGASVTRCVASRVTRLRPKKPEP